MHGLDCARAHITVVELGSRHRGINVSVVYEYLLRTIDSPSEILNVGTDELRCVHRLSTTGVPVSHPLGHVAFSVTPKSRMNVNTKSLKMWRQTCAGTWTIR